MSADGKTIVYEENFGIWKLDVATGKSTEIRMDIKSDNKENDSELRTIPTKPRASAFRLPTVALPSPRTEKSSPSPPTAAKSSASPRLPGARKIPAGRLTESGSPSFPIAPAAKKSGWPTNSAAIVKQISDADCDKSNLVWAPDSKIVSCDAGSDHKLRRVEVDRGKTEILASSETAVTSALRNFRPTANGFPTPRMIRSCAARLVMKPLDGGRSIMIDSEDFLTSNGARWTPDGKKLLLLGGFGAPAMASLDRTTLQLFSVSLIRVEKNPDYSDIDTEAQAEAAAAEKAAAGRGGRGAAAPANRASENRMGWPRPPHSLSSPACPARSQWLSPAPDSRTYLIRGASVAAEEGAGPGAGGGPAMYTIAEDGTRLTRLNTRD